MLHRVILSLGSNLGDRIAHLQAGVDALSGLPSTMVESVSPVYETAPVGGPLQPDYLNIVVALETDLSPASLLKQTQAIETAMDRTREMRWGPRTLDVDLVMFDDLMSDDPELTLPHPRASQRLFVLMPWYDLDHDAVLASLGRVADLLVGLQDQVVRRRHELKVTATRKGSTPSARQDPC